MTQSVLHKVSHFLQCILAFHCCFVLIVLALFFWFAFLLLLLEPGAVPSVIAVGSAMCIVLAVVLVIALKMLQKHFHGTSVVLASLLLFLCLISVLVELSWPGYAYTVEGIFIILAGGYDIESTNSYHGILVTLGLFMGAFVLIAKECKATPVSPKEECSVIESGVPSESMGEKQR